jgi:cytochrome c oxidase subunit II
MIRSFLLGAVLWLAGPAITLAGIPSGLDSIAVQEIATPVMAVNQTREPLSGTEVDGIRVIPMAARKYEFSPKRLVVRSREKIRLEIVSQDVLHGFRLQGYALNLSLPPHQTVPVEFTAKGPGTYTFRCSVYCGPGHEGMTGELVVLPGEMPGKTTEQLSNGK